MNPNAPSWGNNPYAQQQQQQQQAQQGYNPYAQQQQQYNPYAQQQFVPQQQMQYNPYNQQQQNYQQPQQQGYNPYAAQQQQPPQQQQPYNTQYNQQQNYQQPQQNMNYQQQQQPQQQRFNNNQQFQNNQNNEYNRQNYSNQGGYNQQQYNNQQNRYNQQQQQRGNQQYQKQQQNDTWNDSPDQPQPQYGAVKIARPSNNTQNDLDKSDDDGDQTQQQQQGQNKKKKKTKRGRRKKKNKNGANTGNAANATDSKDNSNAPSPSNPSPEKQATDGQKQENVQTLTAKVEALDIESPKTTKPDKKAMDNSKNEAVVSEPIAPSKPKQDKKAKSKPKKEEKSKKDVSSSKDDKNKSSKVEEEKKEEVPKKKAKKKKVKWDAHDPREHLNLVLIGHVDAGKSTISGQILLATNQIDERTIAKYKKEAKEKNRESWWIAYIMDEDDEERNKGKTVECGRAHFDTETKRYTILDAPGHKNYVPNMISGAQQADVAILVISARRGEFEAGFDRGGQTREHGLLAITLGISRIVVVVNKMDCCKWKKDRYDDIKKRVTKFLVDDIGYKKKYIDFLPISGQTATNIKDPVTKEMCPWWDGMTLLQTLDSLKKVKRASGDNLRIPVLDRYKGDKGFQAIGKVEAGIIKKGDSVMIMPTEVTTDVIGLSIDDTPVESVGAGENILMTFDKGALNFDQIYGGCVVCSADSPTKVVEEFLAEIYIHELPGGIMTSGYQAMFHCHNVSTMCEIESIPHKLHKKTMKKSKIPPPFLRSHDRAIARIKLDQKCALEAYDDCGALGRFTLRDQGKTVVIGKIREIFASKSRLRSRK